MSKKKTTYLEGLLDAEMNEVEKKVTFVFQRERIGLKSSAEIEFLKEADSEIRKELVMTDDELTIQAEIPESFKRFEALKSEDEKTRWIFAYQLVEKVRTHAYSRLSVVICPENIVYNTGMTPFFIHYGVMDSLPPFEKNEERVWLETKAVVAAVVDGTRTFEEYVKYHEALDLKTVDASIMSMPDSESLVAYIKEQIEQVEEKEKSTIRLPRKKWKTSKFLSIGLGTLLIPAFLFVIYYFVYEKPKNEAYLDSHQSFLAKKYSEVVTVLSPQSVKDMPYVVLFELAHSFVVNERLEEEQKRNVLNNITLQTDEEYLKYWIYIGRGEAEKAIDLARAMEDGELITYGLLKRREEILAENDLTGEEKQQLLKEIDNEVEEYEKLMEQEQERKNEIELEKERKEAEEREAEKEPDPNEILENPQEDAPETGLVEEQPASDTN